MDDDAQGGRVVGVVVPDVPALVVAIAGHIGGGRGGSGGERAGGHGGRKHAGDQRGFEVGHWCLHPSIGTHKTVEFDGCSIT